MARIYRTRGTGKRLVVRKKVTGVSTTRGVSQPSRKRRMRVKKSKPRRSPLRLTKQRKRKVAPVIVRARQKPFIRSDLPTMIKNNIEGVFQLDFPAATYNYSIGGSLDYFIEKVRNDLTYLYQKYAEPDVEESDVTKPVTEPEFNTKFTNLAWKQLALRPRFRIRRRRTMKTIGESHWAYGLPESVTNSESEPNSIPKTVLEKNCNNTDDNGNIKQEYSSDINKLERQIDRLLEPGYISFEGKDLENALIMKQILEEDITDLVAVQLFKLFYESADASGGTDASGDSIYETFNESLKNKLYEAMWNIVRPWGTGSTMFAQTQFISKHQLGICLTTRFNSLIEEAWDAIVNGYDYDEEVPAVGSAGPSGMKALKLRAPATNLDFYNYLCFRLEPHHDFHGDRVTLKTKSKGAITESNKSAYKVLKRVAEEYDKISKFNIDDFTDNYVKNNYDDLKREFSSYDEFTNLLKIMKKINASQNSVTLSFKEAVDNKITKDSLNKVWGKGLSGQDLALHELIEEVAKLVSGRGIYRDAGGSVFLGRIADLEKQFATDTNIKPLIEKIKSSTEFAERLFDGAGQSNLSGNDSIKVDYFGVSETMEYKGEKYNGKVFNSPSDTDIGKYINPKEDSDKPFTYIIIKPSISKDTNITTRDKVTYTVKLPVKSSGVIWEIKDLTFDSVVYDLSLLIRYYLSIRDVKNAQVVSLTQISANDFKKQCNDMIWVLLNLKRMGDHGQAERAKADNGIFESGDQLAAAYGMMIDVPTIVTYSRQGFGNHFILYGADLDLGQLKNMIGQYLEKILLVILI
jgi:hypothetical protein